MKDTRPHLTPARAARRLAAIGLVAAVAATSCRAPLPDGEDYAAAAAAVPHEDPIARGRYLVTIAGCNDCHTPWIPGPAGAEPDMSRMLSGHPASVTVTSAPPPPAAPWLVTASATNTAWSGPWGVSFTANLTPDPETGLGRWTVRDFKDTLRTGRHMGRGRRVLPPMPIPMYRHLTDADMEAIFGYLRTIPAIRNEVPQPLPPPQDRDVASRH